MMMMMTRTCCGLCRYTAQNRELIRKIDKFNLLPADAFEQLTPTQKVKHHLLMHVLYAEPNHLVSSSRPRRRYNTTRGPKQRVVMDGIVAWPLSPTIVSSH
jgi:hypothetical protein